MTVYRSRPRRRLVALMLVLLAAIALARYALASSGAHAIDASAFSPGACLAYPPTAGNRGETVFLDAGHGGMTPARSAAPSPARPSTRLT